MEKIDKRGFKDWWKPPVSLEIKKRILQKGEPTIEMKMTDDGVKAEVVLKYFDFISKAHHRDNTYFRIISGNNVDVYSRAVKLISDEYLKNFDKQWNRTLYHLLNKPSKNKSMLNLGTYQPKKDESFGLYNVVTPAQLLHAKLSQNAITGLQLAKAAGIDEGTLYRHLKGTSPISRENAISYGKALGCDPAEILFNPLMVPTWGDADLSEMTSYAKRSVYAGEIISMDREELVSCPREIYRPDVHAIRLHGGNYNNAVAFYYHANEKEKPHHGELVIVGVRIKNFENTETRLRYFIGIWEIKGSKINLLNMDPDAGDVAGIEQDEDINSFDDIKGIVEENRYIITDIEIPEFVAPVVSVINPGLLSNEKKRQEIIKDHLNQITKVRAKEQVDQALTEQQATILYHQKKVLDNHYKVQKTQRDMEQKIKDLERKHKNLQKLYSRYADVVVGEGKDAVVYEFKKNAPKGKLIIQPVDIELDQKIPSVNMDDDIEVPKFVQEQAKEKFYDETLKQQFDRELTDKQKEEINAQFDGENREIDTAFPVMKKYIKDKYLHDKLKGNKEFIDTLKVFSKGKRTTLIEIDKLINKYGYTRLIQMFLRDIGLADVIQKAHGKDGYSADNAFETLNNLTKPTKIEEEDEEENKIA